MEKCFQCSSSSSSSSLQRCPDCRTFAFCGVDCARRARPHHLPYCRYIAIKLRQRHEGGGLDGGGGDHVPKAVKVRCFACREVLPRLHFKQCGRCGLVCFHDKCASSAESAHPELCAAITATLKGLKGSAVKRDNRASSSSSSQGGRVRLEFKVMAGGKVEEIPIKVRSDRRISRILADADLEFAGCNVVDDTGKEVDLVAFLPKSAEEFAQQFAMPISVKKP